MVASVPPTLTSMLFGAIGLGMVIYASSQPTWSVSYDPIYVSLGLFQFCIETDCSSLGQTSACGADENGHVTLCAQWFMVNGARAFAVFTLLLASAALSITVLFLFGKSEKRSRQAAIGCYLGACGTAALSLGLFGEFKNSQQHGYELGVGFAVMTLSLISFLVASAILIKSLRRPRRRVTPFLATAHQSAHTVGSSSELLKHNRIQSPTKV